MITLPFDSNDMALTLSEFAFGLALMSPSVVRDMRNVPLTIFPVSGSSLARKDHLNAPCALPKLGNTTPSNAQGMTCFLVIYQASCDHPSRVNTTQGLPWASVMTISALVSTGDVSWTIFQISFPSGQILVTRGSWLSLETWVNHPSKLNDLWGVGVWVGVVSEFHHHEVVVMMVGCWCVDINVWCSIACATARIRGLRRFGVRGRFASCLSQGANPITWSFPIFEARLLSLVIIRSNMIWSRGEREARIDSWVIESPLHQAIVRRGMRRLRRRTNKADIARCKANKKTLPTCLCQWL